MVKAPGAPTSTPRSGSASSRRIVPIRALNPYNETWTIKAKVMGKSEIRMFNMRTGGEGRVASMDLVDEEVNPPCSNDSNV